MKKILFSLFMIGWISYSLIGGFDTPQQMADWYSAAFFAYVVCGGITIACDTDNNKLLKRLNWAIAILSFAGYFFLSASLKAVFLWPIVSVIVMMFILTWLLIIKGRYFDPAVRSGRI